MNFFGMGPGEIIFILVIALIIFGPGKLPEIGASVGRGIRDFRAATRDLTSEFERTVNEVGSAAEEVKDSAREVHDSTMSTIRLDQARASATTPANPLPASAQSGPAKPQAPMPTKADPLADMMAVGEPEPRVHNGATDEATPPAKSDEKSA